MMKPETKAGIDRYATNHVPTGGFLAAVLANDLFDAAMRADDDNLAALADIVHYIYATVPACAYGSRERVAEWTSVRVAS